MVPLGPGMLGNDNSCVAMAGSVASFRKLFFRVISGWAKTARPSTHSFDGGRRWALGGGERGEPRAIAHIYPVPVITSKSYKLVSQPRP